MNVGETSGQNLVLYPRLVCQYERLKEDCAYAISAQILGAGPGFLERGFVYIKVWGFALLILSHYSQISHENEIIWSLCVWSH